ncbi:MAG: hypothetical protein MI921_16960 [Cytophagales bacterium]|nr:hypothetical protein [Cytophagales bacterium]
MIEMINTKEKIIHYLHNNNISFWKLDHPPAASAEDYHRTLGTRYEQQAKALLLRYRSHGQKGFVVVTIQAQKKANLALLAGKIGASTIRLATLVQLKEVTGCSFGELPPIGGLFGLQLLMDKDLLSQDMIYFNAGDLSFSVAMAPGALQRLEKPLLF